MMLRLARARRRRAWLTASGAPDRFPRS